MSHWAEKYIGKPWVFGGRTAEAFDCWGLLVQVYRERYAYELPGHPNVNFREFFRIMNETIKREMEWERVSKPFEGCAVAIGGTELFHHVGIYLEANGGLILHCSDMSRTVAQTPAAMKSAGLSRLAYFKHHGANYSGLKSL